MAKRHLLFLQGMPGPSLRRIARRLREQGHHISRVNFNGGDWFDWRWSGDCFRRRPEEFGDWLEALAKRRTITDFVLFGDRRPLHVAAINVALRLEIDIHVIEEGYIRPDSVTVEYWPRGLAWRGPRSLEECRARIDHSTASQEIEAVANLFHRRGIEAFAHWAFAALLHPFFRHYRTHRDLPLGVEAMGWLRRWRCRQAEYRASEEALQGLVPQRYFLFPLQLNGDAQLVHRSDFTGMMAAIETVLDSFAAHAPAEQSLLIKRHPLDPDPGRWRTTIEEAARARDLGERVRYVEHGKLERLIDDCTGVVTVNSTVGAIALERDRPVHVLAPAVYAMPGLATNGPVDGFWQAPQVPVEGAFAAFRAALWSECLVNGGFHSERALALLEQNAARRIAATAA